MNLVLSFWTTASIYHHIQHFMSDTLFVVDFCLYVRLFITCIPSLLPTIKDCVHSCNGFLTCGPAAICERLWALVHLLHTLPCPYCLLHHQIPSWLDQIRSCKVPYHIHQLLPLTRKNISVLGLVSFKTVFNWEHTFFPICHIIV